MTEGLLDYLYAILQGKVGLLSQRTAEYTTLSFHLEESERCEIYDPKWEMILNVSVFVFLERTAEGRLRNQKQFMLFDTVISKNVNERSLKRKGILEDIH